MEPRVSLARRFGERARRAGIGAGTRRTSHGARAIESARANANGFIFAAGLPFACVDSKLGYGALARDTFLRPIYPLSSSRDLLPIAFTHRTEAVRAKPSR